MIDLTKNYEDLPNTINVFGESFSIYTDFKLWLKCICEVENNPYLNGIDVSYLFKNKVPKILDSGFFNFLFQNNNTNNNDISSGERIFSFNYDQDLIYAAFLEQYNIDLLNCSMHWAIFNTLLSGLSENTRLCKLMSIRAYDGDDKEMRKLKQKFALPEIISPEEQLKIDKFNEIFG